MNGLLELLTNKLWMLEPEKLNAFRTVIQQNLNGHITIGTFEKKQPWRMSATVPSASPEGIQMMGTHMEHTDDEPSVQSFVAILPVCGPVTRNGDACSYGSIDLRDAMIEAVDDENCNGIVLYINTPGGSALAIPDYRYACDYAHANNKPVYAFIDGYCASAGMYLASFCDKRYYMNKEDQVGSIGVMAAFYTEKDGTTNQYTNETYHELYATQSYEKNQWPREAADGNYDTIQKELDEMADKFIAQIKSACPNANDEHLHGAVFNAEDIDGILVDGQRTLLQVVEEIANLKTQAQSGSPAKGSAQSNSTAQGSVQSSSAALPTANNNPNTITMKEYPALLSALGVEGLEVSEEGTFMNAPLLDTLEARLAENDKVLADAKAEAEKAVADLKAEHETTLASVKEGYEQQIASMKSEHEQALTDAKLESDKALADAKAEYEKSLSEKTAEIEAGAKTITAANEELAGVKEALATAEQKLADKDDQIAQLTAEPQAEPQAGAAPANNGEGIKVPTLREFDDKKHYASNAERRAAFEAFAHGK